MIKAILMALYRASLLAVVVWAALALVVDATLPAPAALAIATLMIAAGGANLLPRFRHRALEWGLPAAVAGVALWWFLLPPSNQRDWQPDVAVLPWAEVRDDRVTFHNIRDCVYRSETDYTVRHYERTFDLATLRSVDLFLVYWGSPLIAHTMLSFGFADGGQACFSIETRKERGEAYSAFKGFFRQYELTYVVGDERDLVRLRTDIRGEQVYLYRLKAPLEVARRVFLDYVRHINHLKDHPEWYNALTSNCTTNIRGHTAPFNPEARFDYRFLVNGLVDEMLYERGVIDRRQPFAQIKAASLINLRARSVPEGEDFSNWIRQGLPGMASGVP